MRYREGAELFDYRWPVAVLAGAVSGTNDVTITIPPEWTAFWDTVDSAGADVRLVSADGATKLTYQLASWTYASRVGVLEIDNLTVSNDVVLVWLVWGNSTVTDGSGSFTAASAITGKVYLGTPGYVVAAVPEAAGNTTPVAAFSKTTGEDLALWWNVSPRLAMARTEVNGGLEYEELTAVQVSTGESGVYLAGSEQTAMWGGDDEVRFVETPEGLWVRQLYTAGSDGSDYTLLLAFTCGSPSGDTRALEARALLRVNDPDET